MQDAGRMRHHLIAEAFNGRRDATGEPRKDLDENWTAVFSFWASVNPISGREFINGANQEDAEVTHRIRCRYREGLQTDMRLRWGKRTFEILAVLDQEERHEELLIMAREYVP